jgi:NAD+ kinase
MNLLVVHKISRYQQVVLGDHPPEIDALVESNDHLIARLKRSHDAHERSLEQVREVLTRHQIEHEVHPRGQISDPERFDLVVSVGGDGTVLELSHGLSQTPILGINSDPEASVGYFCAGTAERFEDFVTRSIEGTWEPNRLRRFSLTINDKLQTEPALNDVLVCHANPAALSSYTLKIDDIEESQRSSGLWLSTPAGSTGAIRSAGGLVLPIRSQNLQFLVREPYPLRQGAYKLLKGIRSMDTSLEITSRMMDGRVFLDGPYISYDFQLGDRIRLNSKAPDLRIFGLDEKRRNL